MHWSHHWAVCVLRRRSVVTATDRCKTLAFDGLLVKAFEAPVKASARWLGLVAIIWHKVRDREFSQEAIWSLRSHHWNMARVLVLIAEQAMLANMLPHSWVSAQFSFVLWRVKLMTHQFLLYCPVIVVANIQACKGTIHLRCKLTIGYFRAQISLVWSHVRGKQSGWWLSLVFSRSVRLYSFEMTLVWFCDLSLV